MCELHDERLTSEAVVEAAEMQSRWHAIGITLQTLRGAVARQHINLKVDVRALILWLTQAAKHVSRSQE